MEASIITDARQWNDFVSNSLYCNITQSYEWGELVPLLGAQPLRIGVRDDAGQLCAAMLILVSRAPIIQRPYFYSPRGPVIDDPSSPALGVLLDFVRAEARRQGAFMLKVEPGADVEDQS